MSSNDPRRRQSETDNTLYRRRRSAQGVPIPSFGTMMTTTSTDKDDADDANAGATVKKVTLSQESQRDNGHDSFRTSNNGQEKDNSTTCSSSPSSPKTTIDVNASERNAVLLFCGAVEMQLFRSSSDHRMPLHACYDLMDKTKGLSLPPWDSRQNKDDDDDDWRNEKELFLYKFLHVTTVETKLYEMFRSHPITTSKALPPPQRWYLRHHPSAETSPRTRQLDQVRALLSSSTDKSNLLQLESRGTTLRDAIVSLRGSKHHPRRNHALPQPPESTTNPLRVSNHPDTEVATRTASTVEERVRAKYEARQKRETAAESSSSTPTTTSQSRDETWRLRVADILWAHSRKVWYRHERFASPLRKKHKNAATASATTTTATTYPCSFVLKDAVELISQQTGAIQSLGGLQQKLKRRQAVAFLQELCDVVPEWIRRSSAKQSENNNNKEWLPNDTIWIYPLDYNVIRLRLLGKSTLGVVAAEAPSIILKGPPLVRHTKESGISENIQTKKPSLLQKRPRTNQIDSLVSTTKRALWDIHAESTAPIRTDALLPQSNNKRIRMNDSTSIRTTRPLRVNPNLILTDADYQGGERIVPSTDDSPRGLKNLFHQMNSGKRI